MHVRFKFDIEDRVVEASPPEGRKARQGSVIAMEYSRKGNSVVVQAADKTMFRELEQNLEMER